ncbi:MAG: hypothetical protein ACLGHO_05650 [Gammaproteobacteria bacterium]
MFAPHKPCPHCDRPLPARLVWKSVFTGKNVHTCPTCRERFRLTSSSKFRLSYLHVLLIAGFAVLWGIPNLPPNLIAYGVVAVIVLALLPQHAHYEKATAKR